MNFIRFEQQRACRIWVLLLTICMSTSSSTTLFTQTGVTWTGRTAPVNNNWLAVAYGNGRFVAVASSGTGNRVMTSTDGINWAARSGVAAITWTGLDYGTVFSWGLGLGLATTRWRRVRMALPRTVTLPIQMWG